MCEASCYMGKTTRRISRSFPAPGICWILGCLQVFEVLPCQQMLPSLRNMEKERMGKAAGSWRVVKGFKCFKYTGWIDGNLWTGEEVWFAIMVFKTGDIWDILWGTGVALNIWLFEWSHALPLCWDIAYRDLQAEHQEYLGIMTWWFPSLLWLLDQ